MSELGVSPVRSGDGFTSTAYRVVDVRFPPVGADADQPEGRWHAEGEGPCHYLATTPEGAWAEVLRHEALRDPDDVVDLHRSLWVVELPTPEAHVTVPRTTAAVFRLSWSRCQDAARVLRGIPHIGLIYFDEKDVVRHEIVGAIIKAYERADGAGEHEGKKGDRL